MRSFNFKNGFKQSFPIKTYSCTCTIQHSGILSLWENLVTWLLHHQMKNELGVADIVRRFCYFLLWRREFCFHVVGNFELKKMTPNCNALAKSIISHLWVSYYTFVFSWQCKTMLFTNKKHTVTSSERAHSITWYKQKRRRNRWASKQVSRR